jgi:hypothetical protein
VAVHQFRLLGLFRARSRGPGAHARDQPASGRSSCGS